jgi:hypothetical protein
MRGDFSRKPFRRDLHDAALVHQQGRVWLDGDWNEDVFDRLEQNEREATDVIGPCGIPDDPTTPDDDAYYEIEVDPALGPGDFRIHAGRAYVDGILTLLDADTTYLTQPDLPNPPPIIPPADTKQLDAVVYLDVWRRLITYLEDESVREPALGGPDTVARLRTIGQIKVQPVPVNPDKPLTCDSAHDVLPRPGSGTLSTDQPADTEPEDPCRLPDDALYTGRENRLYRVEIHDPGDVHGVQRPGDAIQFSIATAGDVAAGSPKLTLAAAPTAAPQAALRLAGVATISDDDGNSETLVVSDVANTTITLGTPLVNAYAAARHPTITGGVARFKWSRDNASFAVRVTAVDASRKVLTLASLGRDQATALRAGDLVEIADDASELGPARGHLTYLADDPNPDLFTVPLADALPASFDITKLNGRHLLLRRWDGVGWAGGSFDDPGMDLGDGVRIKFEGFDLHSGDWWTIKTRRVDGSVEQRTQAPPDGIDHHYCVLALLEWSPDDQFNRDEITKLATEAGFDEGAVKRLQAGLVDTQQSWTADQILTSAEHADVSEDLIAKLKEVLAKAVKTALKLLSDCRPRFPPLTHLPTGAGHGPYLVIKLLGGDGQEGAPGDVLPCPLLAGVEDEQGRPVPGITVRFEVPENSGDAVASSPGGPFNLTVDVTTGGAGTDQAGVAAAWLSLSENPEIQPCHSVRARIIKPAPPQGAALELQFEAHVRAATQQPDMPRVVKMSWPNDKQFGLDAFNKGLEVAFSEPMIPASATLDTFVVIIEIPDFIRNADNQTQWMGHRPFIVYGAVRPQEDIWTFIPCPQLPRELLNLWIQQEVELMRTSGECIKEATGTDPDLEHPLIRVRVTLKGNVILTKDQVPLDGNAFGRADPNDPAATIDLDLPSGDGVKGGDFESWFYLGPE